MQAFAYQNLKPTMARPKRVVVPGKTKPPTKTKVTQIGKFSKKFEALLYAKLNSHQSLYVNLSE
jgi:hypothetical protein